MGGVRGKNAAPGYNRNRDVREEGDRKSAENSFNSKLLRKSHFAGDSCRGNSFVVIAVRVGRL